MITSRFSVMNDVSAGRPSSAIPNGSGASPSTPSPRPDRRCHSRRSRDIGDLALEAVVNGMGYAVDRRGT
jgi:hypothetical protein